MNKEKKYLTVMIINLLITPIFFYFAFIYKVKVNVQDSTKCSTKVNCNECENGVQTCQYYDRIDDNLGEELINCPCNDNPSGGQNNG